MRLFAAIPLPVDVKLKLKELQQTLPEGIRSQPLGQMHITLRFLGETSPEKSEIIQKRLQHISAPNFTLTLKGTGSFPDRKPKIIWAGAEKTTSLIQLHQKIEEACVKNGFAPEKRNFIPHITIGKVKNTSPQKVKKWIDEHQFWEAKIFVDRFALCESRPEAGGVIHEAVNTFLLQPDA